MITRGIGEEEEGETWPWCSCSPVSTPPGTASSLQLGNSQLEYLPVIILAHSCAMLSSHPASFPS